MFEYVKIYAAMTSFEHLLHVKLKIINKFVEIIYFYADHIYIYYCLQRKRNVQQNDTNYFQQHNNSAITNFQIFIYIHWQFCNRLYIC